MRCINGHLPEEPDIYLWDNGDMVSVPQGAVFCREAASASEALFRLAGA